MIKVLQVILILINEFLDGSIYVGGKSRNKRKPYKFTKRKRTSKYRI